MSYQEFALRKARLAREERTRHSNELSVEGKYALQKNMLRKLRVKKKALDWKVPSKRVTWQNTPTVSVGAESSCPGPRTKLLLQFVPAVCFLPSS